MKNVATVTASLALAYSVIDRIARSKGTTVKSITINAENSDLEAGKLVGNVTVANRSRKPFTLETKGNKVSLSFMGQKLAA